MASNPLDEMKALAINLDDLLDDDFSTPSTQKNIGGAKAANEVQPQGSPAAPPPKSYQPAREKSSKAEKLKGKMTQGEDQSEPRARKHGGVEIHEPSERKRKSEHARDKPSKKSKSHARDLEVTDVPLDESFLKQTFEEWSVRPVAASIRVLAEVGRVHDLMTEKALEDMKAQLVAAQDKQRLAEQELAAKDITLKTTKVSYDRLREERASMMKDRDDAALKVVGLESQVSQLSAREKDAVENIKALEDKVAELESKQVEPSSDPEAEVVILRGKLVKMQTALKETHASLKTAINKAEGIFKVGFNEALSQVALRHPDFEVDRVAVHEDNRARAGQIIRVDLATKEEQVVYYSPENN